MLVALLIAGFCLALMVAEATYRRDPGLIDHTASGAVTAGEILQTADGRAGVALADIADTELGTLRTQGHFDVAAASGTTFTAGDIVYWDVSASAAIGAGSADLSADFPIGVALTAKISGTLVVRVDLNEGVDASNPHFESLVLDDGAKVTTGTTTGTELPDTAAQKLGLWGVTPIIQPASANQGAVSAQTQDALTDNGGGTADGTVELVTTFTPSVAWNGSNVYPSAADATAIAAAITAAKNNMKEVTTELAKIRTDIANIKTFQDAARTAMVNSGLIKGGA